MTSHTAHQPKRKPVNIVATVMRAFRTTYADAVIPNMSNAQFQEVVNVRRLTWMSPHRLSLADAMKCYDQMATSYNEFHPGLLHDLDAIFGDADIEVTPAREYSVAVYLHVPNAGDLQQRVEAFARGRFDADIVEWVRPGTLRVWWD